jgi:two-component system NtrC family sensor kinase
MDADRQLVRYRELQSYVGWTDGDSLRIVAIAPLLDPHLARLIDDFYAQIERHPETSKVITGGAAQVDRVKGTLLRWIRELLAGTYDGAYVVHRWRAGSQHVKIGLGRVYTHVALSRLRKGLCLALQENWPGDLLRMNDTVCSLNLLLDLDLALVEEAYHTEHAARLLRAERLATLAQVAGGIAHELRTPINVVKTSAYFLRHARDLTPEKQAEHLGRIERQVEAADGVITTLSSLAGMPVSPLRPTAILPCGPEALREPPHADGVRVMVDLSPSLPTTTDRGLGLAIVRAILDKIWRRPAR